MSNYTFDKLDYIEIEKNLNLDSSKLYVYINDQKNNCDEVEIVCSDKDSKKIDVIVNEHGLEIKVHRFAKIEDLKIYIYASDLSKLKIAGSSEVECEKLAKDSELNFAGGTKLKLRLAENNNIKIKNAGSLKTECDGNFEEIKLVSFGSCKAEFLGTAQNLLVEGSGSINVDSENMVCENAKFDCSGSTKATVDAKQIDLNLSGAGKLNYYGSAKIGECKCSGAIKINKLNKEDNL